MAYSVSGVMGSETPASKTQADSAEDATLTTLHVQALDALVSVNSFFTGAVFIGLSFSNDTTLVTSSRCQASLNAARRLIVFEVVAFACYLLSSLIAQGLKLQLAVVCAKKNVTDVFVPINESVIRLGMLATAFSTAVGTVFLVVSIVYVIELRLGLLSCSESGWSKAASIPLIVLGSIGVCIFSASVGYAFAK